MGHYDISITMDIYTHVMEDTKLEAIEKLNNIFVIQSHLIRWFFLYLNHFNNNANIWPGFMFEIYFRDSRDT